MLCMFSIFLLLSVLMCSVITFFHAELMMMNKMLDVSCKSVYLPFGVEDNPGRSQGLMRGDCPMSSLRVSHCSRDLISLDNTHLGADLLHDLTLSHATRLSVSDQLVPTQASASGDFLETQCMWVWPRILIPPGPKASFPRWRWQLHLA